MSKIAQCNLKMIRWCLVWICILDHAVTVLSRHDLLNRYISDQAKSWCSSIFSGIIYSDGKEFVCKQQFQLPLDSLKGINLRVGLIPHRDDYDYDCSASYGSNGLVPKESYSFHIIKLLQDLLKFEVTFVPATTWGSADKNLGNWTGLVGLLKNNLSDVAMCHSTVTRDRAEAVDFLVSTLHSTRSLIYQPARLPLTRDVFVLTFSQTLWLCFLVSLILLIVCFRFSTWQHSRLRPDHEPWSWIEVIMWANAAVCQQSYSRHPKGSSCRTMFLIGYIITYLLYTGFAAGVTSLLAVQGQGTHLNFADVVVMRLKLILPAKGTHFMFLKKSTDPYGRSIFFNSMENLLKNKVDNLEEFYARLDEENTIGFGSTVPLINYLRQKVNPRKHSEFSFSRIPRSDWQKAFMIQKNSPYKEVINYWLIRLKEIGLLNFGDSRYIHDQDVSCYDPAGWSSAGLGNVLSSVIILGGGWFFSVLILFFEMAWLHKTVGNAWEIHSKQEIMEQYKKSNAKKRIFQN